MMISIEEFYKSEMALIVYIQDKLCNYENFLHLTSEIVNPEILVLYIVPLLAALKTCTYIRILIVIVVTEYLNLLVKWMVSANRPYWWVHETDVYKEINPIIRQTRLTCESTSGLPSAHLMYATSILYSMIQELFIVLKERKLENRYFRISVWFTFGFIMIVLALSRMYFACHFFHQCICGVILGIAVAKFVGNDLHKKLVNLQRKRALLCAAGLCVMIFVLLLLQKLMENDPQWSMKMTLKWCNNPLFIRPQRTRVSRMSYDFGTIFGIALSAPFVYFHTTLNYRKSFVFITICVTFHRFINWYVIPKFGSIVHYASLFLINLVYPYVYIVFVPKFCAKSGNT